MLYGEDVVDFPTKIEAWKESAKQQQEILFVVDNSSGSLKLFNDNCKDVFNLEGNASWFEDSLSFLKKIIHPEDFHGIKTNIDSLIKGSESEINTRARILVQGKPIVFNFQIRPYNFNNSETNEQIFFKATAVKEAPFFAKKFSQEQLDIAEVLQESTDKYATLVAAMDEAFCIIDLLFNKEFKVIDYFFVETNPAFKTHVGSHSLNKTMLEIDPGHDKTWFEIYGEIANTGTAKRFQKEAEDRVKYWFDLYAFRIGTHKQVAILFRNITKQKEEEEKIKRINEDLEKRIFKRTQQLQRSKDLLQTVFDESTAATAVFEPVRDEKKKIKDFKIIQVNKRIVDTYNAGPLLGQYFSEASPYAVEIGMLKKLIEAHEEGKLLEWEMTSERTGTSRWYRVNATPQKNLMIFSFEDITERKEEEQKLKDSLLFKRSMAKASPDLILILNLNKGVLHYSNRSLADFFGKSDQDWQPHVRELLAVIHPRERRKALEFHKNLLSAPDDDVLAIEFQLNIKNSWYWFNIRGKVFQRNKDLSVCEYMLFLQDITEQKKIQNALIDAEKLSIKGEVARTLAHELRNPLASIGMATDVLRKKLKEENTAQAENYLSIIKRSAKALNNLVNELLTSTNYQHVALKKTNLSEVLEKTMVQAADRIYLTGIKVIKNYRPEHFILADEDKLKIAILNLIVNAGEAMKPLEGILTLKVEEKREEVVLSISDNGCGFTSDQVSKLFDAFYTSKPSGVGIGLSSVKNILEEHDAIIDVQSEPNKGSTFTISFRRYKEEDS